MAQKSKKKKKKKKPQQPQHSSTPRRKRMSFSQIVFYGFGILVILSMVFSGLLSSFQQ